MSWRRREAAYKRDPQAFHKRPHQIGDRIGLTLVALNMSAYSSPCFASVPPCVGTVSACLGSLLPPHHPTGID